MTRDRGMQQDQRQIPTTLMQPATDAGQPAAPSAAQPSTEETERIRHLRAMLADLTGYIERQAEEIAAPLIESAADRARDLVAEAEGGAQAQIQRQQDLITEMRRRITTADRTLEDVKRYRSRLAAAVGRHSSEPWPTLVAEIETRLKRGSDPQ